MQRYVAILHTNGWCDMVWWVWYSWYLQYGMVSMARSPCIPYIWVISVLCSPPRQIRTRESLLPLVVWPHRPPRITGPPGGQGAPEGSNFLCHPQKIGSRRINKFGCGKFLCGSEQIKGLEQKLIREKKYGPEFFFLYEMVLTVGTFFASEDFFLCPHQLHLWPWSAAMRGMHEIQE